MKNFLITFLFLIFATNNILFAQEITIYNKSNAEKCAQGNCVNGQGTLTWTDGTKYEGEFKDEKMTGQGTFTHKEFKYVGELKDDLFNGQGTITWPNGDKYVGEWKDDKFNGQGTLTAPNGFKYVGEFKDDKRNGQGTSTFPDGGIYVGEFKDNKHNGQGTYTWPSGNKYVGEFKDNKQNGQGTFTAPDGRKYVGEHKDGKLNGQGTYTFANGNKRVGEWKDGKQVDGKTKLIETAANKRKRIEEEKRQRAKEKKDEPKATNFKEEVRQAIQLAKKCYRGLPPGTKDAASRTMSDAINNFNKGRDAYLGIAYDDANRVIRAGQRNGVC